MPELLPLLASVPNLSDHLGEAITPNTPDFKRAVGALRAASNLVRRETGNKKWISPDKASDADPNLPEELWIVVMDAAGRKYLNPEGFEQEREDNWYGSRKVQEAGVYLTATELATCESYLRPAHRGLGTIQTTRDDYPKRNGLPGIDDLYPTRQ